MPYSQGSKSANQVWDRESSLGLDRKRYGKLKLRNEMPYSQGVKSEPDRKGYGNLDLGIQNAVGRSVCRWSVEKYGKLTVEVEMP